MQEKYLERIAIALEKMAGIESNEQLGICTMESLRRKTYIFAGSSDDIKRGHAWKMLDDMEQPVYLPEGAIVRGYLEEIRKVVATNNFGTDYKLEIVLNSQKDSKPHTYVLRFGWDSCFSASFLSAIAPHTLSKGEVLGIKATPKDKAVFAQVFRNHEYLKGAEFNKNCDRDGMLNKIRRDLGLSQYEEVSQCVGRVPRLGATGEPVRVAQKPDLSYSSHFLQRDAIIAQIDGIMDTKKISVDVARNLLMSMFSLRSRHVCSDEQLSQYARRLATL